MMLLAVSLLFMGMVTRVSIQKDCINTGATLVTVLPLGGRRKAVFYVLCVVETLVCYYTAFYFPELIAQNTRRHSFFDFANSVIMVGALTSVMLLFLNRLYEEENELSRQQKKEI